MDVQFTAELQKSPAKCGWTYIVWPDSARFFGTRGLLPVKADVRKAIGKQAGQAVTVRLEERIDG